ncbi:transporter substrate-binding domain-containing protein [Chitinophaga sp. SYP-B3965]|uniref:histidine kinase n=1 Tax=Chitinophaga sp. SYP-B3965 TaxID=2663120 RepID=UPI001299BAFD|nr:histidine kinase [Chitinophaga sp. SYP-B3965]MRG48912.1 transporter substrate-binding domain-containing protein [Chitinophaga sp. SYP-B3965]
MIRLLRITIIILFTGFPTFAGGVNGGDSWAQVQKAGKGTITAFWYDIDPFIYTSPKGQLQGVEFELMESFVKYVKQKYSYDLTIRWENAGSFESIYSKVKNHKEPGIFGWSFFSITPERRQEVNFTPPYMPDLNILVTSNELPLYSTPQPFMDNLRMLQGYTMAHTTMEDDLRKLQSRENFTIYSEYDDYEVLRKIAGRQNGFGYIPLTIYVVALQKGIKVKRQHILVTERPGFAGIFSKSSDWGPVVNEYFQSFAAKRKTDSLLAKYLGSEIGRIIMDGPGTNDTAQQSADIELLTKERELVSQRLIETALQVEHQKMMRNISIAGALMIVIMTGLLYNRYRTKKRLNDQLMQRNSIITRQHGEIELMNRKLQMKVLQAQMNPHFIFNSLNHMQYYINQGDKSIALKYVGRFSRFMRLIIQQANVSTVSIAEEILMLEQYLGMEQIRFTGKFSYDLQVAADVPVNDIRIPPLLLYHYVENSLYHGIMNSDRHGEISIKFYCTAHELVFSIQDNGIGRAAAKLIALQKAGVSPTPNSDLTTERIHIMNEDIPGSVSITKEDVTGGGTLVVIGFALEFATAKAPEETLQTV